MTDRAPALTTKDKGRLSSRPLLPAMARYATVDFSRTLARSNVMGFCRSVACRNMAPLSGIRKRGDDGRASNGCPAFPSSRKRYTVTCARISQRRAPRRGARPGDDHHGASYRG